MDSIYLGIQIKVKHCHLTLEMKEDANMWSVLEQNSNETKYQLGFWEVAHGDHLELHQILRIWQILSLHRNRENPTEDKCQSL